MELCFRIRIKVRKQELSGKEGIIIDFLEKEIPDNWEDMSLMDMISQKYGKTNTKEYLAKKKDLSYNEDEVQKSQIPSGLCG